MMFPIFSPAIFLGVAINIIIHYCILFTIESSLVMLNLNICFNGFERRCSPFEWGEHWINFAWQDI